MSDSTFREIDKDLSVITVKYTTTSIMKDIFKADRLINKNAVPLSLSGPNLRFIGLHDRGTLIRVRLCLTTPFIALRVQSLQRRPIQAVLR